MTDQPAKKEHKWIFRRVGGNPAEESSYEYVRYCEICGWEDTCEDEIPSCGFEL